MSKNLYVGVKRSEVINEPSKRELFWSEKEPTQESHGHLYTLAIGPFRTKSGAEYMANYGYNSPHCLTVNDAERLAALHTEQLKEAV